jgi:hypothetical protein
MGYLIIEALTHTPCNNDEISPNIIGKPGKIVAIAQAFLHEQVAHNIPIIAFSSLLNTEVNTPQQIFHHLLCLSKISSPVKSLYKGTPINPNEQLPQRIPFPPAGEKNLIYLVYPISIRRLPLRIFLCSMLITVPLLSIIGYRYHQALSAKDIKNQEIKLNSYLNKLKPRVQKTKELEQENKTLAEHIALLSKLTNEDEIHADICLEIAKHIPANTWLNKVWLGNVITNEIKGHKEAAQELLNLNAPAKVLNLIIEGKTANPDEVSIFLEKLTTNIPNCLLSIEYIKRPHLKMVKKNASKRNTPYNFRLSGTLKNID